MEQITTVRIATPSLALTVNQKTQARVLLLLTDEKTESKKS